MQCFLDTVTIEDLRNARAVLVAEKGADAATEPSVCPLPCGCITILPEVGSHIDGVPGFTVPEVEGLIILGTYPMVERLRRSVQENGGQSMATCGTVDALIAQIEGGAR